MKPSIQSRLLAFIMSMAGMKRRTNAISKLKGKQVAVKTAKPGKQYFRIYDIAVQQIHERNVWSLAPKRPTSSNAKVILYLHGGAYVYSFISSHWQFIVKIITATNRTVIAPDYPLAPQFTVRDVFAMMLPLYREMVEEFGADNIVIIGDSAGGGMALALAQVLRDEGLPQPERLVLLSPWLDVSMSNPALPELDKRDPILDIQGLKAAGEMYAGDLSVKDPRVSPIFGDCTNLAPMTLFIGTWDMFLADCRDFHTKLAAEGIPLDYHEAAEMLHDWMLMPTPEAEEALAEIQSILQ